MVKGFRSNEPSEAPHPSKQQPSLAGPRRGSKAPIPYLQRKKENFRDNIIHSGEWGCILRFNTVDCARCLFIPRFVWLRAFNARHSQCQVDRAGLPSSYPSTRPGFNALQLGPLTVQRRSFTVTYTVFVRSSGTVTSLATPKPTCENVTKGLSGMLGARYAALGNRVTRRYAIRLWAMIGKRHTSADMRG